MEIQKANTALQMLMPKTPPSRSRLSDSVNEDGEGYKDKK